MPNIFFKVTLFSTLLTLFNSLQAQNTIGVASANNQQQLTNSLRSNGMAFTPNKGQIADMEGNLRPDVLYKADIHGGEVYLRKTGISYVFSNMAEVQHRVHQQVQEIGYTTKGFGSKTEKELEEELMAKESIKVHQINMDFANANPNPNTTNSAPIEGYNNYYYAHCPQGVTNVKQYNKVTYKNIYNGIDVEYLGAKTNGLKYNLIVQPHADPNQIKLHWKGADNIRVNREGNLVIKTSLNEFEETLPKVYQNINGKIVDVKTKYKLDVRCEMIGVSEKSERSKSHTSCLESHIYEISFELGAYKSELPLVIDPWVTYYGGSMQDFIGDMCTDSGGNIYLGGSTNSSNAISFVGFQMIKAGSFVGFDAFLVKFTNSGSRVWGTYYGGSGDDYANSIKTDLFGNIYLAGQTTSNNGIASGGFQNVFGTGTWDAFLVKFNTISGSRVWATYYGGTARDYGNAVATDVLGNVYLTGSTESTANIAAIGFQMSMNGVEDAFIVKFDSTGNRLWGTYYGGSTNDVGSCIVVDISNNVYVGGQTSSTTNISFGIGYQLTKGGLLDAFLVKFNAAGTRIWGSYYGGLLNDGASCTDIDAVGNIYISGSTNSVNQISSGGSFQLANAGNGDAFVAKFNTTSGNRIWATYLGGSQQDYSFSVKVDQSNNHVYVSGDTYSANFPTTTCATQTTFIGAENAFITHFYPDGSIFCSSYFGRSHDEDAHIVLNDCYIYLGGHSEGGLATTSGVHQPVFGGLIDTYLAQLYKNTCGLTTPVTTLVPSHVNNTSCSPCNGSATVNITTCALPPYSYVWSNGNQTLNSSSASNTITDLCAGTYTVTTTSNCTQTQTATFTITGTACGSITANANSATMCSGSTPCPTLTAMGGSGTSPYTYSWNTGATTQNISPCPSVTSSYTVTVKDNTGTTATTSTTVTVYPAVTVSTTIGIINCSGAATGSATATGGGGTSPYTYSWSTGATTTGASSTIPNLSANTYTVTITDSKGCTKSTTSTLISPPPLLGQFTKGTAACSNCGCQEWIMATSTGGTPPYTYQWPDGYSSRYKNKICSGNYTIKVTDKNGCSLEINVTSP